MMTRKYRPAILIGLATAFLCGCQALKPVAANPQANATLAGDARSQELYLSVIEQLLQSGKYYAGLAHIDEFEHDYGKSPRATRLRGDAWLAIGDLAKAETEYASLTGTPLSAFGEHGLGSVAAKRADWQRAATYFQQAVAAQPTNVAFLDDLGGALSETGQMDGAEFALRKALELAPTDEDAKKELRALLEKTGRTNETDRIIAAAGDQVSAEANP